MLRHKKCVGWEEKNKNKQKKPTQSSFILNGVHLVAQPISIIQSCATVGGFRISRRGSYDVKRRIKSLQMV